jgi:hypothetical protein
MARNTPAHFSFKGRFTLRGINGIWYVYDRKSQSLAKDTPRWNTFTKAEKGLVGYKKLHKVI